MQAREEEPPGQKNVGYLFLLLKGLSGEGLMITPSSVTNSAESSFVRFSHRFSQEKVTF